MHLLLSILIGTILLFLLARAFIETAIGLCQIFLGLLLLACSHLLSGIAWCMRAYKSLWRAACG